MRKFTLSFYLQVTAIAVIVFALGHMLISSRVVSEGSVSRDMAQKESAYDRVMRTKTIRCGDAVYPPSIEVDTNTGEKRGYAIDLMNEVGRRLGMKIEWAEEIGYGQIAENLNSNRFDIFCAATTLNVHRAKFTLAANPFFYIPLYLAVRADDPRFPGNDADRANQSDVTFVVVDGDVNDTIARVKFPNAVRMSKPQLTDFSQLLMDIVSHKADVLPVEPYVLAEFDKTNPGALKLIKSAPPANLSPVGFLVNKTETRGAKNNAREE
jgi:ABC-type amino acid transport substrate-binding protein